MTILSISIPGSARRAVFGSSAPATAVLPASVPGSAVPPKNQLLQPPTLVPPSLAARPGMSENGLHGSLSILSSLEDLLGAMRTKNTVDRQHALGLFRQALQREKNLKLTATTTASTAASNQTVSDSLTANLLAFSGADEPEARWAVVAAIEEILKIYTPEAKVAIRLATALRKVMPLAEEGVVRSAARLFAQLVPIQGVAGMADVQCGEALEWLRDGLSERKRMRAIFLITELMKHPAASLAVLHHAPACINDLWLHGITSSKVEIRQVSRTALEYCLAVLPAQYSLQHRRELFDSATSSMSSFAASGPTVHGSGLVCCILATMQQPEDEEHYIQSMWPLVLRVKDKDALISKTAMEFMTIAAEKQPAEFLQHWLKPAMAWLLEGMRKEREQVAAISAVAKILPIAGRNATPYADNIVTCFHTHLLAPRKVEGLFEALLDVIGGCAKAFGPAIEQAITLALDPMFAQGLSPALVNSLRDVVDSIPGLAKLARARLLDTIVLILSGMTFEQFVMPAQTPTQGRRASSAAISHPVQQQASQERESRRISIDRKRASSFLDRARGRSISPRRNGLEVPSSGVTIQDDSSNPEKQILALETLATFDVGDKLYLINYFLQSITSFTTSEHPGIRKAAVHACSSYLIRSGLVCTDEHKLHAVREIIHAVLTVAVTDQDADLRGYALQMLDSHFDEYLSEADLVHMLLCALNDEAVPVRLAVIKLLGRLTDKARAAILPTLRNEMTGLLMQLEQVKIPQVRCQFLRVLSQILETAPDLAEMYAAPVIDVLLHLFKAVEDEESVICCFEVSKRIAVHAGKAMRSHASQFVQICVDAIKDQTSVTKRRAAVITLTEVVAGTACMAEIISKRDEQIEALVTHLAGETDQDAKRNVVRALGMLGASKPSISGLEVADKRYDHGEIIEEAASSDEKLENGLIRFDSSERYDRLQIWVADSLLNQLLAIWQDPTLKSLHFPVVDALVRIYRYELSMKRSQQFIKPVTKEFLRHIAKPEEAVEVVCFYITSLGNFAAQVGCRVEDHLSKAVALLSRHWDAGLRPISCIVNCIINLARAVGGCFKQSLPVILPKMTSALQDPETPEAGALAVLSFISERATLLRDWTHITVPAILSACQRPCLSTQVFAIDVLLVLAASIYIAPQLSRIMPVLVHLSKQTETREQATKAICCLAKECGRDAMPFIHAYERQLEFSIWDNRHFIEYMEGAGSDMLTSMYASNRLENIAVQQLDVDYFAASFAPPPNDDYDWHLWLQTLCSRAIRTTCNHHVRSSLAVAEAHPPFMKHLLFCATWTAWVDLTEDAMISIAASLSQVLAMQASYEVHDAVLHLIDFLSRMGLPLPISPRLLKETAMRHLFLHRASRYAELEHEDLQDESVISDLLRINQQFHTREPDHALGLLELTSKQNRDFAELGAWHSSLHAYEQALAADESDEDASKGVLRSLHALQEWDILLHHVDSDRRKPDSTLFNATAPLYASAAWAIGDYGRMQDVVKVLEQPEQDFYAGVLCTVQDDLAQASNHINNARDALCRELVSAGGYRTGRAYDVLVRTQLLTELEEAGIHRSTTRQRSLIEERWSTRLNILQKDNDVMQRSLKIQGLALSPEKNVKAYVKYMRMCRKNGRKDLAFKAQRIVMPGAGQDPLDLISTTDNEWPGLTLERCRLAYDFGERDKAMEGLRSLSMRLSEHLEELAHIPSKNRAVYDTLVQEKALLGRAMQTLGDYAHGPDMSSLTEAQVCYERGVQFLPTIKGYRRLTSTNLAIIDLVENNSHPPIDTLVMLAVSVIESYVHIITKAGNYPLQDVLGIITIVVKFGAHHDVAEAAEVAFSKLPIDCWMEAIPQLAAHLNYSSPRLQGIIEKHMIQLASAHPHSMLATLCAVTQFPNKQRAEVGSRLLDIMRIRDAELVQEAVLINKELIRVAMTWEEMCLGGIERAAKFIFNDDEEKNTAGMVKYLEDMCSTFDHPQTAAECDFVAQYAEPLQAARDAGRKLLGGSSDRDLARVWRKWHDLHKAFAAAVKATDLSFSLKEVSPQLAQVRNMRFSVPGTYLRQASEGDDISIQSLEPVVEILASKQRPRKLVMRGSDGKKYRFLLKPREDLRLDERCGQMFALVNGLLGSNQEALKRHLRIVRFAVMPLSHNAGLVSWYERGDTLQAICKQQRKLVGLPMDLELKEQVKHAPGITRGTLSTMQQIECFELALECTKGDEMAAVLWKKSTSAATWLERRTAYARSLATTSMVGHLMGLGDRHPSNILQDRITGEAVQIDFGDAFEAAMERDSYPEKMPFRLTRQMITCLGPTGVEGNFRLCSQYTMSVLRDNKEAIEAVFSAYLHDPLIQHLVLNPRQLNERPLAPTGLSDGSSNSSTQRFDLGHRQRKMEHSVERPVTHLSPKAQKVVTRAKAKLNGKEFGDEESLTVEEQVSRLILQATDVHVLASAYQGWCAFW